MGPSFPHFFVMLTISVNDRQGLITVRSFRDGPSGPDPESRDSGFDASHRPGMTGKVLTVCGTGLIPCGRFQREMTMRRLWTVLAALATLSLTNCGYNAIQTNDE